MTKRVKTTVAILLMLTVALAAVVHLFSYLRIQSDTIVINDNIEKLSRFMEDFRSGDGHYPQTFDELKKSYEIDLKPIIENTPKGYRYAATASSNEFTITATKTSQWNSHSIVRRFEVNRVK